MSQKLRGLVAIETKHCVDMGDEMQSVKLVCRKTGEIFIEDQMQL